MVEVLVFPQAIKTDGEYTRILEVQVRIVRRYSLVFLVLSLLSCFILSQKLTIPCVRASPVVHQGDLVLTGNNVTTIENQWFNMNGSIVIEENATLILKNAFLNFTQTESQQFNVTLQNPHNGNPRLVIENSTIASNYQIYVKPYANSSITSDRMLAESSVRFRIYDSSVISLSNSALYDLYSYGTSTIETTNSSFSYLVGEDNSNVLASNCTLDTASGRDNTSFTVINSIVEFDVMSHASSINCSVSDLQSGLVKYWNFGTNSSVTVAPGGWMPNITLLNTEATRWSFLLGGDSNATIAGCSLQRVRPYDFAVVYVYNSTNQGWISAQGSSHCYLYNSSIDMLEAHDNATAWLVNSTYNSHRHYDSGRSYVHWYLDAHVVDQFGQNVASANVTISYSNATQAAMEWTDAGGWTRFTVQEKMMNASGEYPIGNYTVQASYEIWSNSTTVNMTHSQILTLTLSGFVIPEFDSLIVLSLFIVLTLLATFVRRRIMHPNTKPSVMN